jgi:hypothetical protein
VLELVRLDVSVGDTIGYAHRLSAERTVCDGIRPKSVTNRALGAAPTPD